MTGTHQTEKETQSRERVMAAGEEVARLEKQLNGSGPKSPELAKARAELEEAEQEALTLVFGDDAPADAEGTVEPPKRKKKQTPREALDTAITYLAMSSEHVASYPALVEKARLLVVETTRKYNLAKGDVEEVQKDRAEKLICGLINEDQAPAWDTHITQERRKCDSKLDELNAAKEAYATLEKHLAEWVKVEAHDRREVERAATAVLVAEVDVARLLQECELMQRELIARRITLRWLRDILPGNNREGSKSMVDSFLLRNDRELPSLNYVHMYVQHPVNQVWSTALAALMADANAPIPDK